MMVLAMAVGSSCQKSKLTPSSQTAVATLDDAEFATADRIKGQVLGLYSGLKSNNFYGGRYIVYNEVRGDNYINLTSNSVTAFQTWLMGVGNSAQEVTDFWASAYTVINRCNLFIEGMGRKGTSVVGTAVANPYIAEAKTLRAISYYSLLQLYARPYYDGTGSKPGLPLRLTGNSVAGNYDLARSTVAEIYTQILKDLNEAETALPLSYTLAYDNTTRAHRNTVIAFKTRVYLAMQRYSDVITEANKIVSTAAPFTATTGVAHALQADITNVFKSPYTTTESIFSMPMVSGADAGAGQSALGSYFYATKEFSLNDAGIISNTGWKSTDKRRSFVTPVTVSSVTRNYMSKFPLGSPYLDYVPVIRYAEVLLNLGEAIARSTGTVDTRALALLNAIRGRSDATTVFTVASFPTQQSFYDAFLTERNIELLGEGFRSPDLLHLGLTIPGKSTVPAIPPTDARYIWPISSTELLYNHLMKDN